MKRFLCTLLAIALTVFFAACSSPSAPGQGATNGGRATQTAVAAEPPATTEAPTEPPPPPPSPVAFKTFSYEAVDGGRTVNAIARVSPIIPGSDMETLQQTWASVGGKDPLPDTWEGELVFMGGTYQISQIPTADYAFVVGTLTLSNITADSPKFGLDVAYWAGDEYGIFHCSSHVQYGSETESRASAIIDSRDAVRENGSIPFVLVIKSFYTPPSSITPQNDALYFWIYAISSDSGSRVYPLGQNWYAMQQ